MKNKKLLFIVGGIVLAIIAITIILCLTCNSSSVKIETVDDMKDIINKIYEKTNLELMGLETQEVDITDEFALSAAIGISDSKKIKNVVVSEPMIGSIPYSLVIVKVKNKADVEKLKKNIVDGIDMRKWVCVNADILYATSYEDVIFVVYSSKEYAEDQYKEFKNIVNNKVGKELNKKFVDYIDDDNID